MKSCKIIVLHIVLNQFNIFFCISLVPLPTKVRESHGKCAKVFRLLVKGNLVVSPFATCAPLRS